MPRPLGGGLLQSVSHKQSGGLHKEKESFAQDSLEILECLSSDCSNCSLALKKKAVAGRYGNLGINFLGGTLAKHSKSFKSVHALLNREFHF